MPYIKQEMRKLFQPSLDVILETIDECNVGDLNYIITSIIHRWIKTQGLKYKILNAAIGVLDCAKMELYRMVAAPYEDKKKAENGFISELDRITKAERQAIWKCKKCKFIFPDDKVHEVVGSELTHYQCPQCGANSKDWDEIRAGIE